MRFSRLNKQLVLIFLLFAGLIIFLFNTDPGNLPIGLLLLPLIWLFVCLFLTTWAVLGWQFKESTALTRSKRYFLAFLVAILPSTLLLMKSIDQLTLRDSLLLIALVGFGVFYASRLKLSKPNQ